MEASKLFWVATAALTLCAAPARAEPDAKARAEAKALAAKASKETGSGRHEEAEAALRRALALDPSPALTVELARSLLAQRKLVEAREQLRALLQQKTPKTAEATALLKQIEARMATLVLALAGDTKGAALKVDGAPAEAGQELLLPPGRHAVSVEAEGFERLERGVALGEGERLRLVLQVVARTPEAPGQASAPGAAGAPPARPGSGQRTLGYVALGVGGVGAALGAVFGGLAWQRTSRLNDRCGGDVCPTSAEEDLRKAKQAGTAANVALGVGGAALALGAVLLWTAPPAQARGPRPGPWVGWKEAGLSWTF